jgi:hypothetical protein
LLFRRVVPTAIEEQCVVADQECTDLLPRERRERHLNFIRDWSTGGLDKV